MREIEASVEDLVAETRGCDAHLQNVFNSLLLTSNTQFIENVCCAKMYYEYYSMALYRVRMIGWLRLTPVLTACLG